MVLSIENILLIGSLLLFISIVVGKTSYRFGVPTLLFFLGIGMLAGSEGIGGILFDDPEIAQFIGIASLNVILFSGGLSTGWKTVKPIVGQGLVLSTLGVLLTALTLGTFVYFVTDFTIYESLLLGSIVSSTDAAAVFSILRSKKIALRANLRPTLELESGSNDPMAYVLTLIFLSLVINQDQSIGKMVIIFFQQMILGGIGGFAFGYLSKFIINKINLSYDGLYPLLVLALVYITFSATDFVGGNGFLAIYILGIYLANQPLIRKTSITKMFDGFAWLMQIVLFLTLGLLIFPSRIIPLIGIGLLISLFLILIARPVSVLLSLIPFKMRMRRRMYISWVGLRGAVPIVFATYPLIAGIEKAEMIFDIVFFISVTSVLIQGTSLTVVAKWLKVVQPDKKDKIVQEKDFIPKDIPKPIKVEFDILSDFYDVDRKIFDLKLPRTTVITMIQRGDEFISPEGTTEIRAKDKITLLVDNQEDLKEVEEYMNKKKAFGFI